MGVLRKMPTLGVEMLCHYMRITSGERINNLNDNINIITTNELISGSTE